MKKLIIKIALMILKHFEQYNTCKEAIIALEAVLTHWNDKE